MKKKLLYKYIPFLSLGAGAVGFALQWIYFSLGIDDRGLLPHSHYTVTLSWLLTFLVGAVLFLSLYPVRGSIRFPRSGIAALGTVLGALGTGFAGLRLLSAGSNLLFTLTGALGSLCAGILLYQAYCRFRGTTALPMTRIPMILFTMLFLLCRYRQWSTATQLQEYAFPMLASVCIMLACYHRAALENNLSRSGYYMLASQAGAYLSFLAAALDPVYYLSMALWMLTDTCSIERLPKKPAGEV